MRFLNHKTQVSRLGTGSFISYGRRKSRLKEREHGSLARGKGANSNYFRRNQMAQVTYRGVAYDTDRNKAKQTNKVDLTYRGVRQEKELTSLK